MTQLQIEIKILSNKDLQNKLKVLALASRINRKFKNPNICGGYLRDIVFGVKPSDCDVVFDGYMKDQPGVLECVREAENKLGFEHYENWEFENFNATGVTGNIFNDTIGFYSNHTDYLTMLLCDTNGMLQIGSPNTIRCLDEKLYEIRYQGLMVWMGYRFRTYFRSLTGLAARGMYLCHKLNLNVSPSSRDLFEHFDFNYGKLNKLERESVRAYWVKKTKDLPDINNILNKYGVKSLVK